MQLVCFTPMVQRDGTNTLDSYSTHWYIPMESRAVPWCNGMGQTLWTVGLVQYTLVHSYGVLCSPMVQRDGTDSLDSYVQVSTLLRSPM